MIAAAAIALAMVQPGQLVEISPAWRWRDACALVAVVDEQSGRAWLSDPELPAFRVFAVPLRELQPCRAATGK